MNKVTIVVTFLQGETATFTDKPFLEVCKSLIDDKFDKLNPIKILFPKTGKILYFDKTYFTQFVNDEISTEHLVSSAQCDGLFRNITDLHIEDIGVTIDAGSLWQKTDYVCTLVTDEEYITHIWNETYFRPI